MDEARYGDLLKEIRPRIIETPEEHERLLSIAEKMMEKGETLSAEERELLALLVLLIEAFESNVLDEEDGEEEEEAEEPPLPHIVLQRLMESQGVEFEDVVPIFGNPQVAREVLDGNHPISRGQAKELGHYFRVPPKLFRVEPQ